MTKRRWKIFTPSDELIEPKRKFTLDQDGGLVVSFDAVLSSHGMRQQLEAARQLKERRRRAALDVVREFVDSK